MKMIEQNTIARRLRPMASNGLVAYDPDNSSGGYTLFAPITTSKAYLIDMAGNVVHEWSLPHRVGRHVRLLPNGNLAANLIVERDDHPFKFFWKYGGGYMCEIDPNGKVIPGSVVEDRFAHHDAYHYYHPVTLKKRIIFATLEPLTVEESKTVQGGVPETEEKGVTFIDIIREVELSETGQETVFEWRLKEHLDFEKFPLEPIYTREHYPLVNCLLPISYNGEPCILASFRSTSHVVIISRATKEIVWTLGPEILSQQHCVQVLPGENRLLIFDNGVARPGSSIPFSRIIEVEIATKKIVWKYMDPSQPQNFFTPFMGSAERLSNGNTVISDCVFGRIFEVTSSGQCVWEYIIPFFEAYADEGVRSRWGSSTNNSIYRCFRYQESDIPWLSNKLDQKNS